MTNETEILYKKILSDLIKENEFHQTGFSIEDLQKVTSKRTLEKINFHKEAKDV
jgi:hypothetical protein